MKRNTLLLIIGITVSCFLLIYISSNANNKKINNELVTRSEKNALDIIIDSTKNQHPLINERLRNKTIVINVWATWCGPCRMEIPELNKIVKEFKNNDIAFIGLDDEDSTEAISAMKKDKIQFDYQLLFNQKELINIINNFKVSNEKGIPVNMVIGRNGKIIHFHVGNVPAELEKMRSAIKRDGEIKVSL